MRKLLFILAFFLQYAVWAQISSLRSQKILLTQGSIIMIDTLPVVSSSVLIHGYSSTDYSVSSDSLKWLAKSMSDSAFMTYRVVYLKTDYRHKDPKLIRQVYEENPFNYVPSSQRAADPYSRLNTMGNISRGIGFGNAQDIVVNSNLNLRINGLLPNGVEVLAAISDENNPIQPEGNTQQIQDFDQVYITLRKDSFTMTVGDFLMQRPRDSYFVNYYKKSRGLQLNTSLDHGKWHQNIQAEAAISRGRFSRNQIEGIDGNSGPYRLAGSNGEIFIIVIAGTEKVYVDGKLLERGEDNDYVINYNSGEITFTPKVLITRYSRIVVEFQYSDRNYARSVFHGGTAFEKDGFRVYANYFNEMDLKNQPFQQSLDGFDSTSGLSALELLSQVGDQNAAIPNVKATNSFNSDRIMYLRKDSLGEQIYVYTDDPESDSVFYEVRFSNVGFGNGSYVQIQSGANGKVFEYRGVGQGDYAPVELLVAPKRLNMFNIGLTNTGKHSRSGLELSISDYDENTFSALNDNNNRGFGLKTFREYVRPVFDSSATLKAQIDYELVSNGFNFVERYRSVEFNRQWNKQLNNPDLLSTLIISPEHIVNASAELRKDKNSYVQTKAASYLRSGLFQGVNFETNAAYKWKGTAINARVELLNSADQQDSIELVNDFIGLYAGLEQDIWKNTVGVNLSKESSLFDLKGLDSLKASSYGFEQLEAFIRDDGESALNYQFSGKIRTDKRPVNEQLSTSTIGRDLTAALSYQFKDYDRIAIQTAYRQLEIADSQYFTGTPENILQSRIEADLGFIKNFIKTKTFFQVGTGQEQRREFQYLQVQTGNGVYIWNDYDSNGVKTLNEFELASDFDKSRADYIKIYTPVPGFITTRSTKISETVELNPSVLIRNRKGFGGFIGRFYSLSSLLYEQKTLPQNNKLVEIANNDLNDSSLINRSGSFRTSLFFNRTNPKFGADYTFIGNQSKVLLTNGFDTRNAIENKWNLRFNVKRKWTLRTAFIHGEKAYSSQFFSQRDFNYLFMEIQPKLQLQLSNTFRFELKSGYYIAENDTALGGERSEKLELGTGVKFTRAGKTSLQADVSFVKVSYDGAVGTTLGYELLRGLQDGNNATWNLSFQQKLASNIQLVLSYDGRKSENSDVIHIGRMVARYLF